MCDCGQEFAECSRPFRVGDLCCEIDNSCCSPALTLDTIDPDIVAAYDNAYDPDDPDAQSAAAFAAGAQPPAVELIEAYAEAIELSTAKLSDLVCMARYAHDCEIAFSVCVPEKCNCRCAKIVCNICAVEHIRIDQLACHVDPSRVASAEAVTPSGRILTVAFNRTDEAADLTIRANRRGWRLYGSLAENGGRVTITLKLKPATKQFRAAVLSFACRRVRCGHVSGCTRDENVISETNDGVSRTFVTLVDQVQLGLLGDKFADDLNRTCCGEGNYRFGGHRRERVEWVEIMTPETVPNGPDGPGGPLIV